MRPSVALIPGAVLLLAAVGVAGYLLAGQRPAREEVARSVPEAPAPPPPRLPGQTASPAAERLAELQDRLAALEKRLVELEARPQLPAALDDPEVRERVQALAKPRTDDRAAPWRDGRDQYREVQQRAGGFLRAGYDRALEDARARTGLDQAKWKELAPVFNRHFEPVEKALRENPAGAAGRAPRINVNELVAPGLPETLAALQKAMPEAAWKAFDAWRREPDAGAGSGNRNDYFLAPDEFKKAQAQAAVERRWQSLKRAYTKLEEAAGLDAAKSQALQAVLRKHAEKFCAAFPAQPFVDVLNEDNRAKILQLGAETGDEVKKLLGEDGFQKFQEWKKAPDNFAGMLFGEVPADVRWNVRRKEPPAAEPPEPKTAPKPPDKPGAEVF